MDLFWQKKTIVILLIALVLGQVFLPANLLAQSAPTKEETLELQRQLDDIQAEISVYEKQLTSIKADKNTLNKKINQLKIQQSKIALQIKQTKLSLQSTEQKLGIVKNNIQAHQLRISNSQEQMASLIRQIEKKDRYSLIQIFSGNASLSDYFSQLSEYKQITQSLSALVYQITSETEILKLDEAQLAEQQGDQQNLISIANLQSQSLSQNLNEQSGLLSQTKAKESNYQAILSDKQKLAAEIRNRLYDLLGVSKAVSFGEAVTIATWAQNQTGVRAAFLLAILTQESNLGRNVGTCNRPGDPPEKSWKVIMKPERDQVPFQTITAELGMNPDVTPVSCPMKDSKGKQIGWGGAMGPAQFIPSTWMGYRGKVTAITGKTANPWDIRDAFLGAAILLKANGAGSKSGEWAAAMKYFSGSTNTKYRFYGDNVVATADKYEDDINNLNIN